ncbi:hypothetical protein FEM48_Zijuj06G0108300 [Ziziphus jujuba var. spinosa]|uniref:C-JID domain-containing protein n=1 Tax=Ziziphus jujuba var. spinosa TaxID=714518 RepID=A0A978V8U9_ZIZJJ|nr:hypothetical protein FEM48_Zijuj06G0108300 [Ziziphus jujuba var. spinosa]
MEESISFRLPNSFSIGLSSLTSLILRKCNLTEGAIPEDIGCMSSLQFLDLSENNFMRLPQSISQLSKLRVLRMVKCRKLLSLLKLPLSIKAEFAFECPALNYPKDQMTMWTSDKGFSSIFCDKSFENGQARLNMQIPGWFHQQSTGSSITIQPPSESYDEMWIGFALVVIFEIQNHDNFQEDWDVEGTFCHFYTNEGSLGNPFAISFKGHSSIGTYEVWIYVPRKRSAERLNKASHISAVASTNRPDIRMKMCGMHVVFNQDVAEFSRKVAQMFEIQSNPYKGEYWRFKGSVEQDCRIIESDSTSQARRNLQILVPILLDKRCYARNYGFVLQFPLKVIPTWSFHQSVAAFVVCYHPVDLVDKKHLLGFCLYAALTWPNNLLNSETPPACLRITLHAYGDDDDDDYTVENTILFNHQLVLLTTPRVLVGAQLNHRRLIFAAFSTNNPYVTVEMCGIRPTYEQDLGNVTEMITDITLRSHLHFCYQEYSETVEDFPIALEFRQPIIMNLEITSDLYSSERENQSLQELLSGSQSCSVSLCGCKKVGRCSSESSYKVIQESPSKDSRSAVVEHPTAILGDISEISFNFLCHFKTEANCYHPPVFAMTKDIFEWLYLRGFIWLFYIPRCKLADYLNEQSYAVIKIDNESPGVVTRNLGARLLYQQDVEGFTQLISKCMTSFFDNMDLIRQYRYDETCKL